MLPPNARPLEEAQRQLQLLLDQQQELTPGLYHDLALYLQVLRESLLHSVQQACFHLATQVVPERYGQLSAERRQAFQQRLKTLVLRCGSLLTVEQLMGLAAQQERRLQRRRWLKQQRLLEAVLDPNGEPASAEVPGHGGSVHLSLDLPLSADLFDSGVPGLRASHAAETDRSVASAPEADRSPEPDAAAVPPDAAAGESSELKLLQALFQMVGDSVAADQEPSSPAELRQQPDRTELPGQLDSRVTGPSIPRDPLLQLRWWSHFDRALQRRLRNLSHALNVEMLRLGLAQGLLPLNVLDAVLEGQVEALPAPANLLRLSLPTPTDAALAGVAPAQLITVLLRPSDLEYEQPRLRTCRKRLDQRRRALRTMAKRFRAWQRRVAALEAEQQWFQDSAHSQNLPEIPEAEL